MNAIFSHCKNRKKCKNGSYLTTIIEYYVSFTYLLVWYISFKSVNFYEYLYRKYFKQNFTFIISSKESKKFAVLKKEKISSAFNIKLRGLKNYVTCYSCTYIIELGG